MALYSYKSQQSSHGNRLQNIEENFTNGMQYTNTPLTEGSLKLIVNQDIYDGGASLKPRPGLRTTRAFVGAGTAGQQIVHAKEQTIVDTNWSQFFAKGELPVGQHPMAPLNMLYGSPKSPATQAFGDIETDNTTMITYQHATYDVPIGAEIHGMPITDPSLTMAKHLGVTAWNSNYYFLDSTDRKVVHTEWDVETSAFKFVTSDPKVVTSKEATMWGYNMLQANPYSFADQETAADSVLIFTGMLPYDADNNLCMAPVVNQSLLFRAYYAGPLNKQYRIIWEWRATDGTDWTMLKEYDTSFTTLEQIVVPFSPPANSIIMRVSAYGYTNGTKNTYVDSALAVGFNFKKEDYGNTANVKPKTYSVIAAKGITYWNNRLVAWGVPEDLNMLFVSDTNDPTYFPYPNNIDTFDEPIKYAVPFLDYLLVFTASKLHLLSPSTEGTGWSTRCIQNNLAISDWDWHLIQIVKNMVFFRSGNYFYMIVPKSGSTSGELTLAPITKPMKYFFDNFEESVKDIVKNTYEYTGTLTLIHYYNYLDFEDVHNVYVFKTEDNEYLNFCVLYNTVGRSWRIYILGSQNILIPYKADATQRGTLCTVGHSTTLIPQLLRFSNTEFSDFYIPNNTTVDTFVADFAAVHKYGNWQHLDTGYREHMSNFKHRYRELQFVINNISNKGLKFYSDFYIDGEQRKSRYKKEIVQELDIASPKYGIITVESILADPVIAPSSTVLAETSADTESWMLDNSMFPDVAFWKARFPVSGKGYTPRFCLTCRTEAPYELLNISWVYRAMYSR